MTRKIAAALCLSTLAAWCLVLNCPQPGDSQMLRQLIRQRLQARQPKQGQDALSGTLAKSGADETIASMHVVIWDPKQEGKRPLVIFSHGFHGGSRQSTSLMEALCQAGYLVVSPDHKDSFKNGLGVKPEVGFAKANNWSEATYEERGEDIKRLVAALQNDRKWKERIDWSKLTLMGHSLGGYTVLGLAGAWPSWKLPGVKAVVALSPYCAPYLRKKTLGDLKIPVMYQGGTRDTGITPFLKSPDGAFASTPAPVYFVEFADANHFSWTNFNKDKNKSDLIDHYCLAFLSKYVLGDKTAAPQEKLSGVSTLSVKN